MKKKCVNTVQNSDRVDHLASYKMTHNFGASVTFALKFRHCVEAIFLVFRECWETRGMACGPCFFFLLKTMYDILLFESYLGTLDTSNLELVFFLFCGTIMYYF